MILTLRKKTKTYSYKVMTEPRSVKKQIPIGNTLGRLRFERINNSGATGNFLSFDDLVVY